MHQLSDVSPFFYIVDLLAFVNGWQIRRFVYMQKKITRRHDE